jgi:hypothetical protein
VALATTKDCQEIPTRSYRAQSNVSRNKQCELLVQECRIAVVDDGFVEVHSTSKNEKLNPCAAVLLVEAYKLWA